ncbi:uncharacterized protein LOC111021094 [Momordica charantia]|uniref:Uncharacterized protein LOC111021094 n=1 Tax=Momordica charantia TaxID=3673 RepID=A0A6J1DI03_MOMCH|nr:uncharacterized protein LOC111021094 [Momordica charantia]
MSSILSSQGLVIATAMVVSTTALFLAFSKPDKIPLPSSKSLRSCFSSDDKNKNKKKKKKKKKVRFAEDVKEPSGNGEEYRKEHDEKLAMAENRERRRRISCRNQIPPNRVALYNGILKQRSHRMECSF